MKIFKGFCIFVVSFLFASFVLENDSFSDSTYAKHDWTSFSKLPAANKALDLDKVDYSLLNAAVFFATNEQRTKKNKSAFQFLPALRDAANLHSEQMVEKNFLSHYGKTKKYKTPGDRMAIYGIGKDRLAAENIAFFIALDYDMKKSYNFTMADGELVYAYTSPKKKINMHTYWSFAQGVVNGWMHSPPHKKNIMANSFKHLGCAAVLDLATVNTKKALPSFKLTQNFSD